MKWYSTNEAKRKTPFWAREFVEETQSKSALARSLGVSLSSLYYVPKQPRKDEYLKTAIIAVLSEHPAYGCRRIALVLGTGKNRVHRVMQKYGITPHIRRKQRKYGKHKARNGIPNRLPKIQIYQPNLAWAGDFTEINFHRRKLYLATVIDCCTREVLSWQLGTHHTTELILDVLKEARQYRLRSPAIFHSDQGREYTADKCIQWLTDHHIVPSHSPIGKPWHNGRQEAFFATFKLEFGKPSRHQTIPDLTEAIGRYMHYYNTRRIHSVVKQPPRQCYLEFEVEGV